VIETVLLLGSLYAQGLRPIEVRDFGY
jgi:hypothetical protein